ncbi:fatty acid desaturase 6-like [Anneissia japonica]|uniref:fatty acid desaturase 6-like n=1 Tax=Anneissia japonica TaxID=1529436 RepID=UPI001425675C|nr:fatty acid desaturase 6-like [Anneissia japonica]
MADIKLRANQRMQASDVNDNEEKMRLNNTSLQELNRKVREKIGELSWWQCYGVDWVVILFIYSLLPMSLYLFTSTSLVSYGIGIVCLGIVHGVNATRCSHMAAHNGLCRSKSWNIFWRYFFCEFCSLFSVELGMDIHIKVHHPHTNVIGLGDSSSWRVPKLSRTAYMFIAPLLLPLLSPFISISRLVSSGKNKAAIKCALVMICGLVAFIYILQVFSGMSARKAFLTIFASRALTSPSYIHVNIFQHIGMPMYSQQNRPPRAVLMSTGVLNLNGAWILDIIFGHSLISCHLEHHLFPHISDNMCRIVKPLVREHVLQNGLPYNVDSYWNRLKLFYKQYDRLMVNAPPITKYVGIQ